MYATIRRLVPAALATGTLLLAACSDDSKSATPAADTTVAVETTATPEATTPDTTAPATTAPATTEPDVTITSPDTTEPTSATVEYIDPAELLNPVAGYSFQPLPDGVAEALVEQVGADPAMSAQLVAVGAILMQDDATAEQVQVIFFGLDQAFTGADADAYYEAATADGTDIIDVDVDGRPGKAFLIGGRSAFTTLTGTTAILAQAGTTDALEAAVTALFAANPEL